jgi:hypothetical protein
LRIALLFLLLSAAISTATAQTRDPLADLKLPNTAIVSVETVAAGAFKPPAGTFVLPGTDPFKSLPAFRRVVGVINPTSDSDIKFEVWLPIEGWNGNFRGVGNRGFAGSISHGDMAVPLRAAMRSPPPTQVIVIQRTGKRRGRWGIPKRSLTSATARFTK